MSTEFANKVALVTGGASGIGEAVVRELAAGGAKVVIADFNLDAAEKLAKEVGSASAFKVDVADPVQVEALVKFAVEEGTGIVTAGRDTRGDLCDVRLYLFVRSG